MATQASKARRDNAAAAPRAKALPADAAKATRLGKGASAADPIDKATRARLLDELDGAIKRKPQSEAKLAGALRAIASHSPGMRSALADAAGTLVRRGSFGREVYGAAIRTLAECGDKRTASLLAQALTADDAGGSSTLSAACFCKDASLGAPLAKVAAARQSHLAFGAETARVARGESTGAHLSRLAPMIKESHRIALCSELFVPLTRGTPIPMHVSPALAVLRGAERHLGRWLVLADVAVKSGDEGPLVEANTKATTGPTSARAAWTLAAWALSETAASARGSAAPSPPETRPTVELIARLSDRPSADRDTTFLFRMAHARALSCKTMLETLAKVPLSDEVAIRAASYLARDHGRADMLDAIADVAAEKPKGQMVPTPAARRDELRGLAVAALWDAGDRARAQELAAELATSRTVSNFAWAALVRAAAAKVDAGDAADTVVTEAQLRWIQWGWLE